MNKEQVIEGNKLIAEFDGYTFEPDSKLNNIKGVFRKEGKLSMLENELKYHSSWDWLQSVLDKIHDECKLYSTGLKFFDRLTIFSTIEQVLEAVVQFIQWYNKNKSDAPLHD